MQLNKLSYNDVLFKDMQLYYINDNKRNLHLKEETSMSDLFIKYLFNISTKYVF